MELIKRLNKIQRELKAPKNQYNSFGKYNYRSCEDIIEAVKPLLGEDMVLVIRDEVVNAGNHNYIKATACLYAEGEGLIAEATGIAREAESQKGMNDAQLTGSSSSYARKYALNGLFAIDDTKDADTQDNSQINAHKPRTATKQQETINDIGINLKSLKSHLNALGAKTAQDALDLLKTNTGQVFENINDIPEEKAESLLKLMK